MSARAARIRVHALAINCPDLDCREALGVLELDESDRLIGLEISDDVLEVGQRHVCPACNGVFVIPMRAFNLLGAI